MNGRQAFIAFLKAVSKNRLKRRMCVYRLPTAERPTIRHLSQIYAKAVASSSPNTAVILSARCPKRFLQLGVVSEESPFVRHNFLKFRVAGDPIATPNLAAEMTAREWFGDHAIDRRCMIACSSPH